MRSDTHPRGSFPNAYPFIDMMIMSAKLFRWSIFAIMLATIGLHADLPASAATHNQLRKKSGKVQNSLRKSPASRRASMVARAASGAIPNQMPEAPLDGSLVQGNVAQVGFFDSGCNGSCGPVCDCDSAGPSCGSEPACGFEPGCGIGHAMEMMSPSCDCGYSDCDGGCEVACGAEGVFDGHGFGGPSCAMESMTCDGSASCGCDACGSCDVDRIPFFLPMLRINWCRFDFFAGVQGFQGPMNFASTSATDPNVRSGSGSFGFYEGLNEGRSLKKWLGWDLSAQLGLRATQSNLIGSEFTNESRQQVFVTGGLFRRVDYGLQYGGVIDYLNDDWWFQADVTQFRGELSWKTRGCHVFGFQTMQSMGGESSDSFVQQADGTTFQSRVAFEPVDQYRIFYRRMLNGSGNWSAFGGWTEDDDGLLGANLNLPLKRNIVLATSATFLIPNEGALSDGHREEAWNISMGLVYRPGGPKGCGRYCRPLFDVADNGTFIVGQN